MQVHYKKREKTNALFNFKMIKETNNSPNSSRRDTGTKNGAIIGLGYTPVQNARSTSGTKIKNSRRVRSAIAVNETDFGDPNTIRQKSHRVYAALVTIPEQPTSAAKLLL